MVPYTMFAINKTEDLIKASKFLIKFKKGLCWLYLSFLLQYNGLFQKKNILKPLNKKFLKSRSQDLSKTFYDTGTFGAFRTKDLNDSKLNLVGYKLPRYKGIDIDNIEDWIMAEKYINQKMKSLNITASKKQFNLAKKTIPLASQTFSKSCKLFDKNFFPLFAKKGHKQYIEDLDGNKYVDFINGLGAVSIGYSIKEFDKKIIKSIKKGVTFSLAHKIEHEVSKELIKIIPSAEMVRFGKNGTDANSAAIRLVCTKEIIGVCGYHGWQDWYITSTNMNGGIPKDTNKYTLNLEFNNLDSIKKIFKKYKLAAVIIEPLAAQLPNKKFLIALKSMKK